MAKKWAIVIGISQYQRLQSLQYAERDAQAVRDFLVRDARFDQVYSFFDRSPNIVLEGVTISTQPTAANLRRFFELRFAAPFLKQGDSLWFFFSGYGLQYANADYLMLTDSDPGTAETTAINIDTVAAYLNQSGADSAVLFLDACRTEDQKFGQGFGTDPQAVVSIFSTAFGERSYESEDLQLGVFTHVLLEGLRLKSGKPDATIAQLFQYLHDRVPQVSLHCGKPPQTPRMSANAAIAPEAIPMPHAVGTHKAKALRPTAPTAPSVTPSSRSRTTARSTTRRRILEGLAGAAILAIGFVGISVYWQLTNLDWNALITSAELMIGEPPPSSATPAKPAAGGAALKPSSDFRERDNFYQRLPKTGTYAATTASLNASYREISSGTGRFCIKLVNSPTAQTSGYQQIIVSSLSFRENGIYIDATREQLAVDGTFTEITDSKSTWQWLKADVDRSGLVAECLSTSGNYSREVKGGKTAQN